MLLVFTPLARASVQPWAITTIHVITLIALTAFLLEKTITGNLQWIDTALDKPFLVLIVLSALSMIFSMHFQTSFWSFILLLNYLIIFYLVIHSVHTRSQVRRLCYLIIGMAAFLSVFGFFKVFGANPFPWWEYTDIPQYPRVSGTFGNPDHLAGYMEIALPVLLGVLLFHQMSAKRLLFVYIGFLLLAALLLSLSRGGWFGFLTGVLFMGVCLLFDRYFEQKRFVLAMMGGTLALALIVLGSTPAVQRVLTLTEKGMGPNLETRMVAWGGTIRMIAERPLVGSGIGTFAGMFTQYQPQGLGDRFTMAHNDYLQFISEVGLAVTGIMMWMIIALYRRGLEKLKNPSRLVRGTTLGAMSAITAILVHSFVDFNLHIPANAILFTVLAALVVSPLPTNYEL